MANAKSRREAGSIWGQDTIYYEARCNPQETFYEGSEDDDYENGDIRRLRYEAAGRRFLDGEAPLILSAALKGPFDAASGWVNPWGPARSSARNASARTSKQLKHSRDSRRSKTQRSQTHNSVECHLPSPESIKEVSVEPHPFLEDEDVARVHRWRDTIQPSSQLRQDDAWAAAVDSPSNRRSSVRNKQSKRSNWLEKVANRKRKAKDTETEPVETPRKRRIQVLPTSSRSRRLGMTQPSFNNVSPARKLATMRTTSFSRGANSSDEDEDELMDARDSSSTQHSAPAASPVRRLSPKKAFLKANKSIQVDSEDELSQDKLADQNAAATLSSPVSNKREPMKPSIPTIASPCLRTSKHTASGFQEQSSLPDVVNETDMTNATNHDVQQQSPDLGTQEDQSLQSPVQPRSSAQEGKPKSSEVASELDDSSPLSSISSSFSTDTCSSTSTGQEGVTIDDAASQPDTRSCPSDEQHVKGAIELGISTWRHGSQSTAEDMCEEGTTSDDELESGASSNGSMASSIQPNHVNHNDDDQPCEATLGSEIIPVDTPVRPFSISAEEVETIDHASEEEPRDISVDDTMEEDIEDHASKESPLVNSPGADVTMEDAERQTETDVSNKVGSSHVPTAEDDITGTNDTANHTAVTALKASSQPVAHAPGDSHTPISEVAETSSNPPSSGFSFRSILKHLVPLGPWNRSQAKETNEEPQAFRTEPGPISPPEENAEVDTEQAFASTKAVRNTATPENQVDQASPTNVDLDKDEDGPMNTTTSEHLHNGVGEEQDSTPPQDGMPVAPRTQLEPNPGLGITMHDGVHDVAVPQVSAESHHEAVLEPMETARPSTPVVAAPENHDGETAEPAVTHNLPATPRQSTPQLESPLQPFAAFMTPSPEHRKRQTRRIQWRCAGRPLDTRIKRSAMRNPLRMKPSRRVTWAPLPSEVAQGSPSAGSDGRSGGESTETRERQASPPPATAVEDLPTSGNVDFQNHFTAVAKRAMEMPGHAAPSESQERDGSLDPSAMEEDLPMEDTAGPGTSGVGWYAGKEPESIVDDGAELTEQVFQDLQSLLQPWDLDAELDQARKEPDPYGMPEIDV